MEAATLERTYTNIDRAGWPSGSWDEEPDKVQWVDEATGLDCLAVRHERLGHWCGYVGVPPGHRFHGADYDAVKIPGQEDGWPDVHGGLTYANSCQEEVEEGKGICHVPFSGRPDDVWWLGFDCAHLGDRSPAARDFGGGIEEHYKDLEYVRAETAKLAEQLSRS